MWTWRCALRVMTMVTAEWNMMTDQWLRYGLRRLCRPWMLRLRRGILLLLQLPGPLACCRCCPSWWPRSRTGVLPLALTSSDHFQICGAGSSCTLWHQARWVYLSQLSWAAVQSSGLRSRLTVSLWSWCLNVDVMFIFLHQWQARDMQKVRIWFNGANSATYLHHHHRDVLEARAGRPRNPRACDVMLFGMRLYSEKASVDNPLAATPLRCLPCTLWKAALAGGFRINPVSSSWIAAYLKFDDKFLPRCRATEKVWMWKRPQCRV